MTGHRLRARLPRRSAPSGQWTKIASLPDRRQWTRRRTRARIGTWRVSIPGARLIRVMSQASASRAMWGRGRRATGRHRYRRRRGYPPRLGWRRSPTTRERSDRGGGSVEEFCEVGKPPLHHGGPTRCAACCRSLKTEGIGEFRNRRPPLQGGTLRHATGRALALLLNTGGSDAGSAALAECCCRIEDVQLAGV